MSHVDNSGRGAVFRWGSARKHLDSHVSLIVRLPIPAHLACLRNEGVLHKLMASRSCFINRLSHSYRPWKASVEPEIADSSLRLEWKIIYETRSSHYGLVRSRSERFWLGIPIGEVPSPPKA